MTGPRGYIVVRLVAALTCLAAASAGCQRETAPISPLIPTAAGALPLTGDALSASVPARNPAPAAPQGAIVQHERGLCGIWGGFIGYPAYMYGAAYTEVQTPAGLHMVSCTNGPIAAGYAPARTVVVKTVLPPFGECTYRYLAVGKADVVCLSKPR